MKQGKVGEVYIINKFSKMYRVVVGKQTHNIIEPENGIIHTHKTTYGKHRMYLKHFWRDAKKCKHDTK